jgi:hypothetical protein
MPFTCAVCGFDIQVGESMLSDDKMNLAHESCVKHGRSIDPPTVVEIATKVSGPGPGNPTAVVEPCLLPSASKVCVSCQKSAISMCPACNAYVHQNYGYDGGTACSTIHEAKCDGARRSRDRDHLSKQIQEIATAGTFIGGSVLMKNAPKNGKHQKPVNRKKRGRR